MSHTSGKSENDDKEGSGPRPPVPGEECCVGKVGVLFFFHTIFNFFFFIK